MERTEDTAPSDLRRKADELLDATVDYVEAGMHEAFEAGRKAERAEILAMLDDAAKTMPAADRQGILRAHAAITLGMHRDYPIDEGGER